ncbi:tetratricopeptide repeat protein [uncultured Thomasclavelia sp.]|uniref:tetratricopeptide repeat protein n=1 Tax=uncultured Thomasclavelia sp. TaxID=3025759 RepID=UPI0026012B98|nr:tetratricopeptide repeat protein [uncultured Thomasclavelia sp.]
MDEESIAILLNQADGFYQEGKYYLALPIYQECFDAQSELLGLDDKKTLKTLNQLENCYDLIDDFKYDYQIYLECYQVFNDLLGTNHLETLNSLFNFALMYSETSVKEGSLNELYQKALNYQDDYFDKIREDILNKPDSFRINKLIKIDMLSYDLKNQILGSSNIQTITALKILAKDYYMIEKYERSLKLYQQCYQIIKAKYGCEDLKTLEIMSNLAACYRKLYRYQEALTLDDQCYQLYLKLLTENHQDTLNSLNNLALDYQGLESYYLALNLHKKCYLLRFKLLGKNHPDTLASIKNQADVYRLLHKYHQALELDYQYYQEMLEVYDEYNRIFIDVLENLKIDYINLNMIDKANKISQKIKHLMPTESYATIKIDTKRLRLLNQSDKLNQLLLSKDLNSYNYCLSQNDDVVATEFLFNLAFDYYCLKQYQTALLLYRRCYRIYKNNYGDSYPITKDCLKGMMDSYQKLSAGKRYA